MDYKFSEYIKKRESKYLGPKINENDLITIEDANEYFNEFEQLRIGGVGSQREQLLKSQEDYLMLNTKLSVEEIIDFKEFFKNF